MSPRTRFSRIILSVVLVLFAGASLGAQEGPVDYEKLIVEVLESYQELMSERFDEDVDDIPFETWYVITQAINKKFLKFTVDPENTALIHGVQFLVTPESNQPYIFVNRNLLDTFEAFPSLSFTLLSGAFREAYIFFRDPESWRIARGDAMESLFLKQEKYLSEVALVRDRLIPLGYLLTPYETFLYDSYDNDGLISAFLYLNGHSLPVVQALGPVRVEYEESGDADSFRETILEAGRTLLEARQQLPANSEDQQILPLATSIHSWLEITPAMISRIHNKDRTANPLTFPEVLEREKAYADLRRMMEASRTGDMLIIQHVVDETVTGFSTPK